MTAPVIHLVQIAFLAQAALEFIQDRQGLERAEKALSAYTTVLMETSPEDLETVLAARDTQDMGVPTLADLHNRYLQCVRDVYGRMHPQELGLVS